MSSFLGWLLLHFPNSPMSCLKWADRRCTMFKGIFIFNSHSEHSIHCMKHHWGLRDCILKRQPHHLLNHFLTGKTKFRTQYGTFEFLLPFYNTLINTFAIFSWLQTSPTHYSVTFPDFFWIIKNWTQNSLSWWPISDIQQKSL